VPEKLVDGKDRCERKWQTARIGVRETGRQQGSVPEKLADGKYR
jgi:hypothetical protein